MSGAANARVDAPAVGLISVDSPKRRIQQAAIELFLTNGYHGTSIKDITTACGVTPGALYNHFSSKDELLQTIITGTYEELALAIDRALAAAPPGPHARLRALLEAFALFHERRRREALVANLEYVELAGPAYDDIIARRRALRGLIEAELSDGIATGVFALPDVDGLDAVKLAATAIVNLTIRLTEIHGPFTGGREAALAGFHADLALRAVLSDQTGSGAGG